MIRAALWLVLACAAVLSVETTLGHVALEAPAVAADRLLPAYAGWLALWACGGTIALLCAGEGLLALDPAWGRTVAGWAGRGSDAAWMAGLSALAFGLAAWVRLGPYWGDAAGLIGAVLLAGTVPAVFAIVRDWTGSAGGRLAAALWATAPMAVLGAATAIPGTAAAFFGAWAVWALERTREPAAPPWTEAVLGACLAAGLVLDPPTGLGFAFAAWAVWSWDRRSAPLSWARLALVSLPVLAVIAGPIAGWPAPEPAARSADAWRPAAVATAMAFRISAESLGWPIGLLPALFARSRAGAVCAVLAAGIAVPNLFLVDLGPGLSGPEAVHLLLLPAVLAVVPGLVAIRAWNPAPEWGRRIGAWVLAAVLVTAGGYTRVRLVALYEAGIPGQPVEAADDAPR